MSLSDSTLLGLAKTGGGFALSEFAARGIQMTMTPIDESGHIVRDVNGNLVDLSLPAFRKYKFHLSCTDQESPGFAEVSSAGDGLWPGMTFTLICLPELGAGEAQTFTVMLMAPGWQVTRDEWDAVTGWTMDLEEA